MLPVAVFAVVAGVTELGILCLMHDEESMFVIREALAICQWIVGGNASVRQISMIRLDGRRR